MKHSMPMIAALALALAVPVAFARSGSAPPMTEQQNEQQQLERAQQELQNRANEHSAMPVQFDQLDVGKAGYLTKDDAKNDAWLSRNFRLCDTDENDQVSRAEYTACTAKAHKPAKTDKMEE